MIVCLIGHIRYIPVHESVILIESVRSEGSDESVHMRSLLGAFASRMHAVWI